MEKIRYQIKDGIINTNINGDVTNLSYVIVPK
jgi:hypothetical protein